MDSFHNNDSDIKVKPISDIGLEPSWKAILEKEFLKPYMLDLKKFLIQELKTSTVYPKSTQYFEALNLTPFNKVKVVILGQDPYHEPYQAHGLCFSVNKGVKIPPSLQNIYKELYTDLNITPITHGYLKYWAIQGVLLLNSILTVKKGAASSHRGKGWEQFTDAIIQHINDSRKHIVFLLWGRYAIDKAGCIDKTKHLVLTAAHPSPLSAYNGFFGCHHFSKANEYLINHNITPIDWDLSHYDSGSDNNNLNLIN